MNPDAFAGILEPFAMLCVYVHVSDMSVWFPSLSGLPIYDSALLAGT